MKPPTLPNWLEQELGAQRRSMIEVAPRRGEKFALHCCEWWSPGSGAEATEVLAFHGNPTWSFSWRKVAKRVCSAPQARGFHFYAPDIAGLGLSQRMPADAHTLDRHADLLAEGLRVLGLRQPILVVQDWGGVLGVLAVGRAGLRPRAMVVLNTVLGPPRPGFRPTPFHRFAATRRPSDFAFQRLAFPQAWLWTVQGRRGGIDKLAHRAYRWALRDGSVAPQALARVVPDGPQHPSIPVLEESERYVRSWRDHEPLVPARLVWGLRDPILAKARSRVRRMLGEPLGERRTPAGHFPQEEVPEEVAAAIVEAW